MDKKKKINTKTNKRGGGGTRGNARGGGPRNNMRGNMRGNTHGNVRGNARGNMRGNNRGNMRGRNNNNNRQNNQTFNNKRGQQWKRYPQNSVRGGFVNKRYNTGNFKSNLTRSRSNLSLNRMSMGNSPRSNRGGFPTRRGGGKFGGLTRSRSRTNLAFGNNKPTFMNKATGFLKRTSSMPNLRDPSSVYNRLGYQSPSQIAYRSKVKRAKNVLIQRQSKAARMKNALMISPSKGSPLEHQTIGARRYSVGSLHSDQLLRAQRRSQYEQKLMRMGASRSNMPMSFSNSIANNFNSNHPGINYSPATLIAVSPRQLQRGRSPFRQSLQELKAAIKSV